MPPTRTRTARSDREEWGSAWVETGHAPSPRRTAGYSTAPTSPVGSSRGTRRSVSRRSGSTTCAARTNPDSTSVSNRSSSSADAGAHCSRRSCTTASAANPSLLTFGPTADRSEEVKTLQEPRSYVTEPQSTRRRKNPLATGLGTHRDSGGTHGMSPRCRTGQDGNRPHGPRLRHNSSNPCGPSHVTADREYRYAPGFDARVGQTSAWATMTLSPLKVTAGPSCSS